MDALKQVLPLLFGVVFLFLIIVWDMDKQYDLSEEIHNDHSDIWRPMNHTEMTEWYSDADLCALKNKLKLKGLQSYQNKYCKVHSKPSSAKLHHKQMCAVGSSSGRSCAGEGLGGKDFYLQRLVTMEDAGGRSVLGSLERTTRRLLQHHLPLVFIGDQISKQNEESFICETMRTSRREVSFSGNMDLGMKENISNLTLHWRKSDQRLNLYFIRLNTIRPHRLRELTKSLDSLQLRHKHMVIIANVGTWYYSRERFRNEMEAFLRYLDLLGHQNLVLFRETSAQHWNVSSHGYLTPNSDRDKAGCVALEDASADSDWKNKDVASSISNDRLRHIHVIPFRDITAPLFSMHAAGDCSQFCYFPQLWQTVFYYMDIYTERLHNGTLHLRIRNSTSPTIFNRTGLPVEEDIN